MPRHLRWAAAAALLGGLAACGAPVPDAAPGRPPPTASVGASPAGSPAVQGLGAAPASPNADPPCRIFPADNVWHADVSRLPVHRDSDAYVASIGVDGSVHADFGSGTWQGGPIGIPITRVPPGQPGGSASNTRRRATAGRTPSRPGRGWRVARTRTATGT